MATIVGYEQPDLDDLLHYGVLGMKWGKTRAKADTTSIKRARGRNQARRAQIKKQESKINTLKGKGQSYKKEEKTLSGMKASYLKNPDRVIASRMTKGEKYTSVILGTLLTGPVGLTAATAAIVGTSARSRAIENRLDNTKKK